MMRPFAVFLGILAIRSMAEAPKTEPPPPARAPVAGKPFDDREIISYLEVEGRKLLAANRVSPLKTSAPKCSLPLGPVAHEKAPLAAIVERAESATVVLGEFYKEKKQKEIQFASAAGGFLVGSHGAVLTSLHVITEKESRGFVAMLRDGRVFAVHAAIAVDPGQDLVVLQLDVPDGTDLPALTLAETPVAAGAPIAVMSHPDEHFWMLTTGTVARNMVWRGKRGDEYYTCITAEFAKGSSGCPVLDECGNVVAIVNNTESIYYDDDGKKKQLDLQMVIKNATSAWVARGLFETGSAPVARH